MRSLLRRLARYVRWYYRLTRNRCAFCGCRMTVRHYDCHHCRDGRFCHRCGKMFNFASSYGASAATVAKILSK